MGMYDRRGDYQGRPGMFGGRFMIAVIIALIGLYTYWSQVQENPVTGKKQHIAITPEQEIKLGLQSAPYMAHQMGGEVSSDDPRTQEVRKIGQILVSKTEASRSPWKFKFHLLSDPKTVNAFALPGGQVFITLGLLNELQTEAQLAGVLGHEMGHVIERHSAEQMARSNLGNMLIVAVGTGMSDPNSPHGGYTPQVLASVANQMIQLRYGRGDELEADTWGLQLMAKAGYDPKAMLEVMKILEKAGGKGGGPEMLLTHPYPEHRIKEIEAYLKEHPPSQNLQEGAKLHNGYIES